MFDSGRWSKVVMVVVFFDLRFVIEFLCVLFISVCGTKKKKKKKVFRDE